MSLNIRKALPALIVGVVSVVGAPSAEALGFGWHGGHGSSGGSSGYGSSGGSSGYSYGSSGGSSGYSYGSSGGSSGGYSGHQGLFARWHARHHGGWGSSGGSSGYSYGSSGGSSGYSYGSSGGSSGGSAGAYYMDGAPANMPAAPGNIPAPVNPNPAANPMGAVTPEINAAVLNVAVPADAKVYVNGYETKSTGNERRYVSNGLVAGKSYTYELKAEVVRAGQPVVETKVVRLTAGEATDVQFTFDAPADAADKVVSEPLKTKLTLKVPTDAKVFIAGRETKATGDVREFATTKLAAGQKWNDYTVRVEWTQDGQTVSAEEKLTLVGGQDQELEFEVDAPKLAAAN